MTGAERERSVALAKLDQAMGEVSQVFLPMIHSYFSGLVKAGFTPQQALELTKGFQDMLIGPMFRRAQGGSNDDLGANHGGR